MLREGDADMSAGLEKEMPGAPSGQGDVPPLAGASLLDMLKLRDALTELDDIPEPTPEDLAAMDDLDLELEDEPQPLPKPQARTPSALALLAAMEEPELVSLESLDQPDAIGELDDELEDEGDDEDDFVDDLLENYADMDVDDASLHDEGYDLDDDDIENFQDLYGEDGVIIPSFREGELDDDDESDVAAYDDLR